MLFLGFLVALPMLIIVSLSVFGGGQVFMPIFAWLWSLIGKVFGANINEDTINNIFTVSNTTPGVVSTKFAFFTGYIVADGQWWGFIAMFVTYLVFCLPAIIIMVLAMKYITKFKNNTLVANLLLLMKPIVAGIMLSLAVSLLISIFTPEIKFNSSTADSYIQTSSSYFVGYKNILLKIYVPVGIFFSWLAARKKWNLFVIILINISISLFLFADY
ncbi:chromate transporter [Mycoplasma nasistruthionis]|uniref:chromate transporter n=1 Tax=Mycoplasma nasistruthionis TaxID=353852 RepID=UPI0030B82779